jgi:uncharacterized transporter YbjL
MDAKSLARVERLNYLIGAVLIVVCAVLTPASFSLGAAAGVVITCLNFAVIRRLVDKLLSLAPDERSTTALFFAPKMVGLLLIVTLVLFFLPISAVGFAIGFSVFFLSIMVESIRFMSGSTLSH